jgi:Trk K+ transport system NAD-binding subunit
MKYIICGLEHVGLRVAEALLILNEEVSVITLHENEPSLFYIKSKLQRYTEGDARNAEILQTAGIKEADYLLVFTSNEIKNIEINCKAKQINPNIQTALLINNLSYAKIIEQGFGSNCVFHLPTIVALPIVSACINKNILHTLHEGEHNFFFSFINCEDHRFLLNKTVKEIENTYNIKIVNHLHPENKQVDVLNPDHLIQGGSLVYITSNDIHFKNDDSTLHQKNISEIHEAEKPKRFSYLKKISLSPGIQKVLWMYFSLILFSTFIFQSFLNISLIDSVYFVITTTTSVGYGDFNLQTSPFWIKLYGCFVMLAGTALLATLFSVLTDNIISKRLGRFAGIDNRKMKNHIIVAGIGSIGLGVVEYLVKMGIKTVVIERDSENKNIPVLRNKVPILIGDASDEKILLKAGIKKAKTLAALIDNDLNNINIILKGNAIKDELHTVARIFNNELNSKSKTKFDIDNVLSASNIAVPYIVCNLLYKNIIWSGFIYNSIYTLIYIEVNASNCFADTTKNQIFEKYGLYPLLIKRAEKIIVADEELIFKLNDQVYLFGSYHSLKKLAIL